MIPGHHHVVFVNGLAENKYKSLRRDFYYFDFESPFLQNISVFSPAFVMKNVPADQLADFPATFFTWSGYQKNYSMQATFPHLPEGSTLLFYVDRRGPKKTERGLSVDSSMVVLYPENLLQKPVDSGKARLYTFFDFVYVEATSEDGNRNKKEVFTSSGHDGELTAHLMRNLTFFNAYTKTNIMVVLGYLDPFEVEIGSNSNSSKIVMNAGELNGTLELEPGATYIQVIQDGLPLYVSLK